MKASLARKQSRATGGQMRDTVTVPVLPGRDLPSELELEAVGQ